MEPDDSTGTAGPPRKQRQPRAADADDPKKVSLTDEAQAALRDLRTLIRFSGEDEAAVLSPHIIAERDARIGKLRKGAVH